MNVLLIELGTSNWKISHKGIVAKGPYDVSWLATVQKTIGNVRRLHTTKNALVASVKPVALKPLIEAVESNGIRCHVVRTTDHFLQRWLTFDHTKGVGIDRVLGMIGALDTMAPPLVTIDFGTATTINLVDATKAFCGGSISPSPYVQMLMLRSGAPQLPEISLDDPKHHYAVDTATAMLAGVWNDTVGGTIRCVRAMIKDVRQRAVNVPVVATGGSFSFVERSLRKNFTNLHYVPDLVFRGMIVVLPEIVPL